MGGDGLKFAYADPPYLGLCSYYKHDHREPYGCWDQIDAHAKLVDTLTRDFDGWAMSLSTPTLGKILALCPEEVRVAAWVKPFCSFKPGVHVAYAWEPIIFKEARKGTRDQGTVRDFIAANITLKKGLVGAKPVAVCRWLLDLLNVQRGDDVIDLFTGTGVMSRVIQERLAPGDVFAQLELAG